MLSCCWVNRHIDLAQLIENLASVGLPHRQSQKKRIEDEGRQYEKHKQKRPALFHGYRNVIEFRRNRFEFQSVEIEKDKADKAQIGNKNGPHEHAVTRHVEHEVKRVA